MSTIAWDKIDWAKVRSRVTRYQERIYKASIKNDQGKVRFLQKQLISSLDAKLYAVLRVTTWNKGKNTPGVDGKVFQTNSDKILLVKSLRLDGKAAPIRRVWIPKPGKTEKRPLGIPVIRDRAKQALCLLALEPEWEARFEPNSYGFRPGRSCHDAMEAIFIALGNKSKKVRYKYILDADLKKCFDTIDHQYLINKINSLPEINKQVKAWLRAGIMDGFESKSGPNVEVSPNQLGTPQGGIISLFLANVALHGLENHLKEWICTQPIPAGYTNRGKITRQKALSIIRYADDFVVIHPSKETLIKSKNIITDWLKKTSGLKFNDDKTYITNSAEGITFLGFTIIQINRHGLPRYKSYPSKKAQKQLLEKVREIIQTNQSVSSYVLITKLRPVILGWANYYRYCECKKVFQKLAHKIFQKLRAWVFRRDTRNGRKIVKERYFPSGKTYIFDDIEHNDNWILYGETKDKGGKTRTAWLPHISWVKSKKWIKIKNQYSVFNGKNAYWASRSLTHGNWNRLERTILRRQKGFCPYCKVRITNNDRCEVDHIIPTSKGGNNKTSNKQLLHLECHIAKTRSDNKLYNNASKTRLNLRQEPDEGKLSRPDLSTRLPGNRALV